MIEGINILSGTYVLNWTGTATATVNGSAVVKGGTVALTGGANCTVRFSNGTFSLPQLEPGGLPTVFEGRSHGLELALCQRYGEAGVWTCSGFTHFFNGDTRASFTSFAATKRIVPTVALSTTSISIFALGANGSAVNVSGSVAAIEANTNGFSMSSMGNFANLSTAVGGGDYTWGLRNQQTFFASAEL